jgi:cyclase
MLLENSERNVDRRNLKYPFRLIARLDIKGQNLIKGIQLEGLRRVGSPLDFAQKYYEGGIDELLLMDVVASLYCRDHLLDVLKSISSQVFVPITVGGGVRTMEDFGILLENGADKVAINSAALNKPSLISECAAKYGNQAVVVSIEAKKRSSGYWEALYNCGRENSGRYVHDWVSQAVELGAGEVLVTSVDREGTRDGFDLELVSMVTSQINVPVIASGGMGMVKDLIQVGEHTDVSGVAIADALHFGRLSLAEIRLAALAAGLEVRNVP